MLEDRTWVLNTHEEDERHAGGRDEGHIEGAAIQAERDNLIGGGPGSLQN